MSLYEEGSSGGSAAGHPQGHLALSAPDWVVLACHLTLTLLVGLFVTSRKQSGDDAMLAGRSMSGVTIALSLISGLTSGISYLGFPAYILEDGVGQLFIFLAYLVVIPVGALVLIPFFHSLNLVTAYTYFELRFGRIHRTIAAMLFISRVSLYLGVVLYAPALLLHTCLAFPLWATILFTGCLSTLWTIKGGMFAVVYTDAIQSIAMIIGVLSCLICTMQKIEGGPSGMYNTLDNAGMLQWRELVELHPTRHKAPAESIWALWFGVGVLSLAQTATDQLAVQRFLTAKSLDHCVRSFVYSGLYNIVWTVLMGINGLAILGYYKQTQQDPVKDGLIEQADQILPCLLWNSCTPYFAIKELPRGIAGLLVAAVLGSTMSVYSGGLNAAATCFHIDILSNALGMHCAKDKELRRLRVLTFAFAILTVALSFVCSLFSGIVVLSNLILGVCAGPLLGMFLMGMLSARVNHQGALFGVCSGGTLMLYYGLTQLVCPPGAGDSVAKALPEICKSAAFSWWGTRIESWWSGVLGTSTTIILGTLASLCFPRPAPAVTAGLTVWNKGERTVDSKTPLLADSALGSVQ